MKTVLQLIEAHFAAMRPRRVTIPGAGPEGAPLVLFARPLTLADHAFLAEYKNEADWTAHVIIRGIVNEAGLPAFTLEDKNYLKTRMPAAVARLLADAVAQEGPGLAELGESSPALPVASCVPATPPPPEQAVVRTSCSEAPLPPYWRDGLPSTS